MAHFGLPDKTRDFIKVIAEITSVATTGRVRGRLVAPERHFRRVIGEWSMPTLDALVMVLESRSRLRKMVHPEDGTRLGLSDTERSALHAELRRSMSPTGGVNHSPGGWPSLYAMAFWLTGVRLLSDDLTTWNNGLITSDIADSQSSQRPWIWHQSDRAHTIRNRIRDFAGDEAWTSATREFIWKCIDTDQNNPLAKETTDSSQRGTITSNTAYQLITLFAPDSLPAGIDVDRVEAFTWKQLRSDGNQAGGYVSIPSDKDAGGVRVSSTLEVVQLLANSGRWTKLPPDKRVAVARGLLLARLGEGGFSSEPFGQQPDIVATRQALTALLEIFVVETRSDRNSLEAGLQAEIIDTLYSRRTYQMLTSLAIPEAEGRGVLFGWPGSDLPNAWVTRNAARLLYLLWDIPKTLKIPKDSELVSSIEHLARRMLEALDRMGQTEEELREITSYFHAIPDEYQPAMAIASSSAKTEM